MQTWIELRCFYVCFIRCSDCLDFDFSSSVDGFTLLTSRSLSRSWSASASFSFFSVRTHAAFRLDPGSPKKCRARFGLNQQTDWCGPCRCVPLSRLSVCSAWICHSAWTRVFPNPLHCVSFAIQCRSSAHAVWRSASTTHTCHVTSCDVSAVNQPFSCTDVHC